MKIPILFSGLLFISVSVTAETLRLDMSSVMELSGKQSVEAIAADQRVQSTLARIDESRAPLYPQITATASQMRQTMNFNTFGIPFNGDPKVGPFNVFDARLRLTQTLFDKSAMQRLRQARSRQSLTENERMKVRQDATLLGLTLFVEARRAEQAREAAAAMLQRDIKALAIAEQRFRNGSGTSLDAAELAVDVSASRQRVAQVETEYAERRFDLLALLGMPLDTEVLFSAPTPPVPPQSLNHAALQTQSARHPDVQVASYTVISRRSEEVQANADYYPHIEGVADYGLSGNLPNQAAFGTYRFGGQLSLPLWEGGQRSARRQSAIHNRLESEARLQDSRLRVEARARTAQVMLEQTWELIQATEKDRQVAEKQLRLAETRLRNGLGSDFERLDRRTTLIRTIDAWNEAVASYDLARIQKAAALGQLDTLKERPANEKKN